MEYIFFTLIAVGSIAGVFFGIVATIFVDDPNATFLDRLVGPGVVLFTLFLLTASVFGVLNYDAWGKTVVLSVLGFWCLVAYIIFVLPLLGPRVPVRYFDDLSMIFVSKKLLNKCYGESADFIKKKVTKRCKKLTDKELTKIQTELSKYLKENKSQISAPYVDSAGNKVKLYQSMVTDSQVMAQISFDIVNNELKHRTVR